MAAPKKKRGRPTTAASPRGTLAIRISAEERAAWERAAALEGARQGRPIALTEWVRLTCTQAAR